jgi:hypothetical protein
MVFKAFQAQTFLTFWTPIVCIFYIEILQSKLSALKLYASDLQTFLGGRTILREVEEEEMCVTALLEEKCLQQVNVVHPVI